MSDSAIDSRYTFANAKKDDCIGVCVCGGKVVVLIDDDMNVSTAICDSCECVYVAEKDNCSCGADTFHLVNG